MSDQETNLFAEAMHDVTPLPDNNKIKHYSREKQQQTARKTIKQLKRQPKSTPTLHLNRSVTFAKVGAFETVQYAQKGVQLRDIKRLKSGDFVVQSLLDLHGCTHEQALCQLNAFLAEAIAYRLRFLRIVHGKGYNSDSEFPILKNLTNEVLRQCPQVIAFSSAMEKDGGVGAVNVLLKA
ncbi:hypothetical protein THMIRHAS_12960 [Thiosulfatimonas sediminis]|uniref:Smr domain-containing protein n=1 Tax=Thiosulfatimonas sediminis TaxID=2675054 RepID=A0A6F8PUW1_9GAMM|nr:Smr/MutS family protein [Thiosulfatimonas sediminis]BBP45923.1 hypothetical protein THMIRHAS_12960 [Thiosulfatimonas sediminis]